jgi:type IV pilus assembly protein PilM
VALRLLRQSRMPLPFFNTRARRRDEIIAIDLGGRHTKAVHVQNKGDRPSLIGYTIQDSPSEQSSFSVDVLTEHLKNVAHTLGDGTKAVVISLGVAETVVRRAEMPPMPLHDMRQLLKFNSKNYLQQDLPDHVFDCAVMVARATEGSPEAAKPAAGQKQKLIVGGAKQKLVEDIQTAAREAGLNPVQIVPGLIGPLNSFESSEPEAFANESVALVDLGFRNTTISMLQRGELIMHRIVNMGGDRITQGLADSLGISYAEAEGIKVGMANEVGSAIEPLVGTLGRELRAFIDFFEHQQDVAVSQVFVSGGSARSELIVQALQLELLVPCKLWNPARGFDASLPSEQTAEFETIAPQLAVAIGAALSAI